MKKSMRASRKEERGPAIYIRVSPELDERIRLAAKADRRSLGGWVRVAIEEKLERETPWTE